MIRSFFETGSAFGENGPHETIAIVIWDANISLLRTWRWGMHDMPMTQTIAKASEPLLMFVQNQKWCSLFQVLAESTWPPSAPF